MSMKLKSPVSTPSKPFKSTETTTSKKRKSDSQDTGNRSTGNDVSDVQESVKRSKKRKTVDVRGADGQLVDATPEPSQTERAAQSIEAEEDDTPIKSKKKRKKDRKKDVIAPEPETEEVINDERDGHEDTQMQEIQSREASAEPAVATTNGDTLLDELEVPEEFEFDPELLDSSEPTSFYSTRISLYLPAPPVSLSSVTSSLLSLHLAPLLLTYFPPSKGIVCGYRDPVLSARPGSGPSRPLLPPKTGPVPEESNEGQESESIIGDEFCAAWVWLTVTFLVFRPQKGDKIRGSSNVFSEGFVGMMGYNYFQMSVEKRRIPGDWRWSGLTTSPRKKKTKKGKLRDEDASVDTSLEGRNDIENGEDNPGESIAMVEGQSQDPDEESGYFRNKEGKKIDGMMTVKIVDTEAIPMQERQDKLSLQIYGSLLDEDEEEEVLQEDKIRFEHIQSRFRQVNVTTDLTMAGGVG